MDRSRSAWSRRFGQAAEDHASRWLGQHGLTVLARGFRCREGELDVVAREGATVVVVEVKARSRRRWGRAVECVGTTKQRRLVAATRRFLWDRGLVGCPVRFDVLAMDSRNGKLEVRWLRDAFRP